MPPTPVRVLLVEDSDVYRSSLELLLGLEEGIDVVGAVATGSEALALASALRPDVALVDLRLPGMSGVATMDALREAAPRTVVLCLTAEASAEERAAVLAAGAVGLVGKDEPVRSLADALRTVLLGPTDPA